MMTIIIMIVIMIMDNDSNNGLITRVETRDTDPATCDGRTRRSLGLGFSRTTDRKRPPGHGSKLSCCPRRAERAAKKPLRPPALPHLANSDP